MTGLSHALYGMAREMTVTSGEPFCFEAELVRDLIARVKIFSARLHGLRSQKHVMPAAAPRKDGSDDQDTEDPPPSDP